MSLEDVLIVDTTPLTCFDVTAQKRSGAEPTVQNPLFYLPSNGNAVIMALHASPC